MIGYSIPNKSQMRVCNADLGRAALLAAGAGMLLTRGGPLLLRALAFVALAFALGAVDFRFFGGAFALLFLEGPDLGLLLVGRSLFAFGAEDFRFFGGVFVVLF